MIRRAPCSGFTLIELAVVIAIILFLAVLVFSLKHFTNRGRDPSMIMMMQITESLSRYLDCWPNLGSNDRYGLADANGEPGFRRDPWNYINKNNVTVGKISYVDIPVKNLVKMTGSHMCVAVSRHEDATHITDKWGRDPNNALSWQIENSSPIEGGTTFLYTKHIVLRSCAGTPNDPSDDIGYEFKSGLGRFDPIKFSKDKPEDRWNINADFVVNGQTVHIDNRPLPGW